MVEKIDITSRKIGFPDAMIWVFTVMAYVIFYTGYGSNPTEWEGATLIYKLGVIPTFDILLALLTRNYKSLKPVLESAWQIAVSNNTNAEKRLLIQNNLEKIMEKWYGYWIQFTEIILSKDTFDKKWSRIKLLFKEIYTGEINVFQMIWILGYIAYTLLVASNYLQISTPIDFIINICFFTVLLYSKGDFAGIKDLLFRILLCLIPSQDEKTLQANMTKLIEEIRIHNELYNDLALENDQTQAQAPALSPSVKVAPKGELFTPEQIQKDDLKALSQLTQEQILLLQTEKAKINGEIKSLEKIKDI